jgi:hypothetical protein
MDAIILQILNGLDKGSAYALIALGLTLIFGTLGVVNFAHGAHDRRFLRGHVQQIADTEPYRH